MRRLLSGLLALLLAGCASYQWRPDPEGVRLGCNKLVHVVDGQDGAVVWRACPSDVDTTWGAQTINTLHDMGVIK